MYKIITYGTFDVLHYGHIYLLQRAKALGDHLTVGVSSDEFNKVKGKTVYLSLDERIHLLSQLKCVDEIIVENSWEQKIDDVEKNKIDMFCIGDDWVGQFDFLSKYCAVRYLQRTPKISSSLIKGAAIL